jgi:hypothetical protein
MCVYSACRDVISPYLSSFYLIRIKKKDLLASRGQALGRIRLTNLKRLGLILYG